MDSASLWVHEPSATPFVRPHTCHSDWALLFSETLLLGKEDLRAQGQRELTALSSLIAISAWEEGDLG